jgi:hypothetical protein
MQALLGARLALCTASSKFANSLRDLQITFYLMSASYCLEFIAGSELEASVALDVEGSRWAAVYLRHLRSYARPSRRFRFQAGVHPQVLKWY